MRKIKHFRFLIKTKKNNKLITAYINYIIIIIIYKRKIIVRHIFSSVGLILLTGIMRCALPEAVNKSYLSLITLRDNPNFNGIVGTLQPPPPVLFQEHHHGLNNVLCNDYTMIGPSPYRKYILFSFKF